MITALVLVLGCGGTSYSSSPIWTARVADVSVVGPLEDAAVARAVDGRAAWLEACGVEGGPDSEFAARLDVGNDGRVTAVAVRVGSGDAKVDQCLAKALKKIRFVERTSGDPSIAMVTLTLATDPNRAGLEGLVGNVRMSGAFTSMGTAGSPGGLGGLRGGIGTRARATPTPVPPPSRVTAGRPSYTGPTDKELLQKIIQRHLNPIRYCYETGLAKNPGLAGTVTVSFTIDASGHVSQSRVAKSSLGAPSVETCVAEYVKKIRFPAPKSGGIAIVTYPFTFAPAP